MDEAASGDRMRLAWCYDLDACWRPTGVTRHALAMREELSRRPDVALRVVTGRTRTEEGKAYWKGLQGTARHRLPLGTREMLRWWRVVDWPAVEAWTGALDWVYCPAELYVPVRRCRRAVTSHDVLQDLSMAGERRRRLLERVFLSADLVLSVSAFNTSRLLEAFPGCAGKVALVPNAAEDLFFEAATEQERQGARKLVGLPEGVPYLLSVANFQARKNLGFLIRAAGRLEEVRRGELAMVLVGSGDREETEGLFRVAAGLGDRARVVFAGYQEGTRLRSLYAEARGFLFPSLCESFGIPVVEAMAQGCPVILANSTALPEVGGEAGWYFDPADEDFLMETLRELLGDQVEASRRVEIGRERARRYRWSASCEALLGGLREAGKRG